MIVNMSNVWDRSAEFLSDNLSALTPIVLLAIFVPISIMLNLSAIALSLGAAGIAAQGVSLLLSLVILWGSLAVSAMAIEPVIGRRGATERATQRFLPAVAVSLLLLVLFMLLLLPFIAILAASGVDPMATQGGNEMTMSPGAAIGIVLYFPVLIVFALWFGARIALWMPVVIMERRGVGILSRAFLLTRRLTWKIIGLTLLYGLLLFVSYMAVRFGVGAALHLLFGGDGAISVASVLAAIFTSLVLTAFSVIKSAFVAKLYLAVRDAREAIVEAA